MSEPRDKYIYDYFNPTMTSSLEFLIEAKLKDGYTLTRIIPHTPWQTICLFEDAVPR